MHKEEKGHHISGRRKNERERRKKKQMGSHCISPRAWIVAPTQTLEEEEKDYVSSVMCQVSPVTSSYQRTHVN